MPRAAERNEKGRRFVCLLPPGFPRLPGTVRFHPAFAQGNLLSGAPATSPPLRQLPGHLNWRLKDHRPSTFREAGWRIEGALCAPGFLPLLFFLTFCLKWFQNRTLKIYRKTYSMFGRKTMWRKMFFFSLDRWKNGDLEHGVSSCPVSQRQELRSSDSQPGPPLRCLLPLQCTIWWFRRQGSGHDLGILWLWFNHSCMYIWMYHVHIHSFTKWRNMALCQQVRHALPLRA